MAAQGIGLRPAMEADRPFLRALYGAGRAAEMAFVGWPAPVAAHFLDDQFRLQHHHFTTYYPEADFLVVTARGAAAGRLVVDRTAPMWCVVDIALTPAMQGGGWGTALFRWLQQTARADGARGIELHVAIDNVRAEALYRRLGFEPVASDSATHGRMTWAA